MVDGKKTQERRSGMRYVVNSKKLTINTNKPGKIVDISSGGISFEYFEKQEWPDGCLFADVLFGEDDFYLDNMPMKAISNHEINVKSHQASNKPTHKCSFQFGELSKEQKDQLDYFININCKCHNKKGRN